MTHAQSQKESFKITVTVYDNNSRRHNHSKASTILWYSLFTSIKKQISKPGIQSIPRSCIWSTLECFFNEIYTIHATLLKNYMPIFHRCGSTDSRH